MNTVSEPIRTESEKLERFVNAVNSEVDKEIDRIISEAEASKMEMIEAAKDESLNMAYDKIKDSVKKVQAKYVKIVSKAELDSKKDVLIQREKLTQKVFDNIMQSLIAFREKPQYLKYLIDVAKSQKLNDSVVICLRAEDMKYSSDIKKALGVSCEFREDATIKLGGLSVLYADQGMLMDKTIDLALSEQRDIFNGKNYFSQG